MPRLNAKRQIKLPIDACEALGLVLGDDVRVFAANGVIMVIKQRPGAAFGLLKKVRGNRMSDEESLRSRVK